MKHEILEEYKKMDPLALELIIELAHECASKCDIPSKEYHECCEIEMYADIALKSKIRGWGE